MSSQELTLSLKDNPLVEQDVLIIENEVEEDLEDSSDGGHSPKQTNT